MQAALSTRPVQLEAYITEQASDLQQAFALRYTVFSEAFNANIDSDDGLDKDEFDEVCHHLVVKDISQNKVVAYSRILVHSSAQASEFYSAGEFELTPILTHGFRYMEIGRTCIDANYRSGAAIALLWGHIAQFMLSNNIDALMGCASIDLSAGTSKALSIMNYLRQKHFTQADQRAVPKQGLPQVTTERCTPADLPPLLKAYLRMGCKACGEAYWDKAFNTADVLLLLHKDEINMRYLKHFLR
ncbi:GNAT family N-acetyltransferase [Bermanella sp. R86510]|uniref:GNAT family N-acetyltransferase n=1 Tax=unclassified Bermanella TaxID=2627862 RepID=UPI0037C5E4A0